jgi:hypothetical protein
VPDLTTVNSQVIEMFKKIYPSRLITVTTTDGTTEVTRVATATYEVINDSAKIYELMSERTN